MSCWGSVAGGVALSLVGGQIACAVFLAGTRRALKHNRLEHPQATRAVPGWVIGVVERTFFTALVMFNVSGYPTAMMAYLVAKVGATWDWSQAQDQDRRVELASYRAVSLLGSVISLTLAFAGGLIAAYSGCIPKLP